MAVLQADGLEVDAASLRVEAAEREPEGGERDRDVVQLAEDRDHARDEIDGRGEVAGRAR